jgi:hypothetical protein
MREDRSCHAPAPRGYSSLLLSLASLYLFFPGGEGPTRIILQWEPSPILGAGDDAHLVPFVGPKQPRRLVRVRVQRRRLALDANLGGHRLPFLLLGVPLVELDRGGERSLVHLVGEGRLGLNVAADPRRPVIRLHAIAVVRIQRGSTISSLTVKVLAGDSWLPALSVAKYLSVPTLSELTRTFSVGSYVLVAPPFME